ncbi:metal-dependent hydrolase [Methanocella sp. CWC-04]|uniref:Metal-dependent hydrolase n=1 Tax=Methanooceanicella nereidis TaxID=2052831 RepID=A0AAP2RF09_9EURY|nr:metal-dependent hydrolase [Methanocella sp. CWC-04]
MNRTGHFGGSLLLFYGTLYVTTAGVDSVQALGLSAVAAAIAAAMSVKPDMDNKFLWGIFHRTWITHSLTTVIAATIMTYIFFSSVLKAGILSHYMTLAMFSATLSHVLLDSLTKKGVPFYGPFDNRMRGPRWFNGSSTVINYTFLVAGVLMALIYYGIIR